MKRTAHILLLAALSAFSSPGQESAAEAARRALEGGDYARAESLYRTFARAHPNSAEALSNLGVALHFQNRHREAVEVLRQALRLKETPAVLALLGASYCKLRQHERAHPILLRAKPYLSDQNVLKTLAPCYLEAGEPLDAMLVYQELARRGGQGAEEALVNFARASLRASRHFASRLEGVPGNRVYLDAIEAARRNRSADARGAMATALRSAPYLRPDLTLSGLSALLSQHGREAALLYFLAVACGEQSMQAYQYCEKAFPKSRSVRTLRAEILASQYREEEAIAEYQSLLREDPRGAGMNHQIALAYRRMLRFEKALPYYQAEAKIAPGDERPLIGISECLLRLGRYEEVRRELAPILAAKSPPGWALLDAASAEEALEQYPRAISLLERAAVNTSDASLHYRLSRLYRRIGQEDLAAKHITMFRALRQKKAAPTSEPPL